MSFNYLRNVGKIVCIGRNYAAHIKELNNAVPKMPFYFLTPTSSLITPVQGAKDAAAESSKDVTFTGLRADGSNPSPIYIPRNVEVHHEVELGLVLSRPLSNIDPNTFGPQQLMDSVRGFCLALDLTGRNVQSDAKKKGLPWFFAKGYDTFCPVSQMLEPSQLPGFAETPLEDIPGKFRLQCSVNGELRQSGSCDLMLNPMHRIVSHIAEAVSLQEGDLVLTGTPAGVGQLNPGDTISAQLYFGETLVADMSYDCVERPGQYVYKSS